MKYDAVVLGGGFYGCSLAIALAKGGATVALVEREPELLRRASYANQARVHNGYHYPRSILTSLRSRVNYTRFLSEYADAVDDSFTMVYAIARRLSKLNAQQFVRFCHRIGAEILPAPEEVASLFDPLTIEASFVVTECAFDARRLSAIVGAQLDEADVDVMLTTTATRVRRGVGDSFYVECVAGTESFEVEAGRIFNCTYSAANHILQASGFSLVALKHELTEIALVEVPAELEHLGITVMDGPFFSVMPFPPTGGHSMTHVRYTPHGTWQEGPGFSGAGNDHLHRPPKSNFAHMLRDTGRYVPALAASRYKESLWEVKTVLPQSEHDDSRPILLHRSAGTGSGVWTVLGAKIDGAYDVQDSLRELAVVAELSP